MATANAAAFDGTNDYLTVAGPSYENNLGSGDGLTENGTLVSAVGPEISAGTIIFRRRREYVGAH